MDIIDWWPFLGLIVLGLAARPLSIYWNGAALRRQGATEAEVRKWALAEAKKARRNPAIEIIRELAGLVRAWRGGSS